jgi:hypothetical protein
MFCQLDVRSHDMPVLITPEKSSYRNMTFPCIPLRDNPVCQELNDAALAQDLIGKDAAIPR